MLPALFTQTAMRYLGLAVVGFQMNVFDAVHGCDTQLPPSKIHHWYWCGAAPPVGVALQMIVLFGR